MSEIIIGQVRFLLMTSLLGMALMGAYDVFRFVRWLIPLHAFIVGLGDILFWLAASLPAYALFFVYNDGEIRWYGALAVFLGGLLYEKGISLPVRRLGDRYFSGPKRKIIRALGNWKKKGSNKIKRGVKKVYSTRPKKLRRENTEQKIEKEQSKRTGKQRSKNKKRMKKKLQKIRK